MRTTEDDLAAVEEAVAQMYGKRAWGTALGFGSFLTVEFGAPEAAPDPGGPVHGEFHLWVYCTAWRIENGCGSSGGRAGPRMLG